MSTQRPKHFMHLIAAAMAIIALLGGCKQAEPTPAPEVLTSPSPTEVEPASVASDPFKAGWDDREVFSTGLINAEQPVLEQLPGATIYHIELEIPAGLDVLQGHQELRYTNQENEPLNEVYFRLFPNTSGGGLTVSNVKVDGADVESAYEAKNSSLRVPLPSALQPGERAIIEMDFEVTVTRTMAGNYGLFGYFEEVLVLDEFYPAVPAYDEDGWYAYAPYSNGDLSYFDASFYLVRVTAPADLIIVAPGVEVNSKQEGDQQIVTIAAGPARDFYLAASEHYVKVSNRVGDTIVNSYTFAEYQKAGNLALEIASHALNVFSDRFGTYPYTEFDVASTPMQALGIEYPGMTGITLGVYDLNAEIGGLPAAVMMESVIAHEVGHQWFYNAVGNDQMGEPWVDEAIVQYLTGLYFEDRYSNFAAEDYRDSWDYRWSRVDYADIPIGLPAGDYEGREYGAIVYGRGPIFIQTLAKEMGQETFDIFLRDYYQTYKWDIGTGTAFWALAEQHCQCDLTKLFLDWVYDEENAPTPTSSNQTNNGGGFTGWAVLAQKDNYSDVNMTDLPVDYIGITQMREILINAGWNPKHIHELKEFDGETLRDDLDWLAENAAEEDVVLVYVAAHGRYLSDVLEWNNFFADAWEKIPSRRRVLVIDACQAANFTGVVANDPAPYLSIAAVDGDEYGWSGLEEEGLPIIGGVFTHYFNIAFSDKSADSDGDGCVSVQEAALFAEQQQRTYMHEVVFAVPEFLEMYHGIGSFPDEDPTFPDVILDDTIGMPLCLDINQD